MGRRFNQGGGGVVLPRMPGVRVVQPRMLGVRVVQPRMLGGGGGLSDQPEPHPPGCHLSFLLVGGPDPSPRPKSDQGPLAGSAVSRPPS